VAERTSRPALHTVRAGGPCETRILEPERERWHGQ
jgi:hypothetical protein